MGQRFGRLTVIKEKGRIKTGGVLWQCKCDCGNVTIVSSWRLRCEKTMSCGCLRKYLRRYLSGKAKDKPEWAYKFKPSRQAVMLLMDGYVKRLLCNALGAKVSEIPNALIELKRVSLKLTRARIKEGKEANEFYRNES